MELIRPRARWWARLEYIVIVTEGCATRPNCQTQTMEGRTSSFIHKNVLGGRYIAIVRIWQGPRFWSTAAEFIARRMNPTAHWCWLAFLKNGRPSNAAGNFPLARILVYHIAAKTVSCSMFLQPLYAPWRFEASKTAENWPNKLGPSMKLEIVDPRETESY